MKQYKTTIIAIIVIAVIVGAYFIISPMIGNDDDSPVAPTTNTQETGENVFPVSDSKEITKYECNLVDNIVLEKQKGEWVCTTYMDIPINQADIVYDLNRVLSCVATVVYDGEITGETIKNYDINEAEYIKITDEEGKTYTLCFGMQKPGSAANFAMVKENSKIYLMNTTYKGYATITLENIIHTELFSYSDTSKIKNLIIYKNGEKFVDLSANIMVGGRTWNMSYPLERKGNDTQLEQIITSVSTLTTMEYIEGDCKDLSKYGLEIPEFVISLKDNKGVQKMSLGKKVPEGNAYYCLIGDNNVFSVAAESLSFVDDTELEYMNTYIYIESYEKLKSAEVSINCDGIEEKFELGIEITEDAEKRFFNSQLMDTEDKEDAFKHLHTSIYELNLTGLCDAPAQKGECLISIKYTSVDGVENIVEGYRRDDNTMYLYMDGEFMGGYEMTRQITGSETGYGIVGSLKALEDLLS